MVPAQMMERCSLQAVESTLKKFSKTDFIIDTNSDFISWIHFGINALFSAIIFYSSMTVFCNACMFLKTHSVTYTTFVDAVLMSEVTYCTVCAQTWIVLKLLVRLLQPFAQNVTHTSKDWPFKPPPHPLYLASLPVSHLSLSLFRMSPFVLQLSLILAFSRTSLSRFRICLSFSQASLSLS